MSRVVGNTRTLIEDDFDYSKLVKKKKEIKDDFFIVSENNKKNVTSIKEFLSDNEHKKIPIMAIKGTIGCGKITLLKKCIEEAGFNFEEFNQEFDENEAGTHLKDIYRMIEHKSMDNFLISSKQKNFAIIIKDFDNSLRSQQQSDFFDYIKKLGTNILNPIFLISNLKKKFPKFVQEIKVEHLTEDELITLGTKTFVQNESNIEKINESAKTCNGDIRHFLESVSLGNFRDFDLDNKSKFTLLLDKGLESNEICSLNTNYIVYNNYIHWYIARTTKNKQKESKESALISVKNLKLLSLSSTMMSYADIISDYIYKNNLWDDYAIMTELCVLSTLYPLNLYKLSNESIIDVETLISKTSKKESLESESFESEETDDVEEADESEEQKTAPKKKPSSKKKQDSFDYDTKQIVDKSLDTNTFYKLSDLNYILKYILTPKDYKQFIIDNRIKNNQLKILCEGISKENATIFKKIFKSVNK